MKVRCQGEKAAAADERHQQALSQWSALPRQRRWMARRPERERPDPPSRQDLAAARDELVTVVSSAMITELEKVVPRPRAGLSACGRCPDPAGRRGAPPRTPAPVEAGSGRWPGPASCRGAAPGSGPHPGHAAQAGAGDVAAPAPGSARPRTGTRPLIDTRDDSGRVSPGDARSRSAPPADG